MTAETIQKCIESLEDEQQKDFIRQCLVTDPASRPKARDLLFHPVLFEVGRDFNSKHLRKNSSSMRCSVLTLLGTFSQTSRRPHPCQEPRYELMSIFCWWTAHKHIPCTMCSLGSMFSFQPNKLRHILRFISYSTYICPNLFGWKENLIFKETVIFK